MTVITKINLVLLTITIVVKILNLIVVPIGYGFTLINVESSIFFFFIV